VGVRRGRLGAEGRQQARPKVGPFRCQLVAGAGVDLGVTQRRHGDRVQGGERVLGGEQQRQRLQPDQVADQLLGGEWLAEPFAAAKGDVQAARQQQLQRGAEAAVVAGDQLGVRCVLAGGAEHPRGGVLLGEQVDQQRATIVVAVQLLDGLVVEGEQLAGANQQPLAVGGECHAAGGAGQQAHAELPLQPGDVAAEGLLSHVQPRSGAGEVQLLGDRHEMAQQAQVKLARHRPHLPLDQIDTLAV
jgi:hypothetical protein